jgi:hypothetical protein
MSNGELDDDDTTTPIDLDARRPEVPLGRAWYGFERSVSRTLDGVRAVRRDWSEASPEQRAALAFDLAGLVREFADYGHELANQLEEFARHRAEQSAKGSP